MPLYEFKCKNCGKIITKLMSVNEDSSNLLCDQCGGNVKKIISVSNFEIRGFNYSNGYSKKDK
jgi:putative FmdB family regulatory protein